MPRRCGDRQDGVDIATLAVEMDRHDGLGSWGDFRFDSRRVDVINPRVDIDEDRLAPVRATAPAVAKKV